MAVFPHGSGGRFTTRQRGPPPRATPPEPGSASGVLSGRRRRDDPFTRVVGRRGGRGSLPRRNLPRSEHAVVPCIAGLCTTDRLSCAIRAYALAGRLEAGAISETDLDVMAPLLSRRGREACASYHGRLLLRRGLALWHRPDVTQLWDAGPRASDRPGARLLACSVLTTSRPILLDGRLLPYWTKTLSHDRYAVNPDRPLEVSGYVSVANTFDNTPGGR